MINRYILREVVMNWLGVTGLLLVLLLTNEMARVLSRAADNQYPSSMVLELIGLGAVNELTVLVPVGLFLGVVFALGRLYHDSEVTAALACGVSPARMYLPVLLLAALLSGVLFWLSLDVAPSAFAQVLDLRAVALRAGQFAPVTPGRFRSFGGGAAVVYAQGAKRDGTLENVFVERSRDGVVEVALADRARHEIAADGRSLTITLYDGERFTGTPGRPEFRILRFGQHTIPVQMPPIIAGTDLDAVPTASLWHARDLERQAELQWRLALPVMCLVLALVAVPLSRLRPRQGRYARLGLAILLFLIYLNLITAGRVWLQRGRIPPQLGLWWTHVAILVLALLALGAPRLIVRLRHRSPPREPASAVPA